MNKYVVVVAALPLRKTRDHKSELINQVLFGEEFLMLEQINSWLYIKTVLDHYEGWVENRPEYFEPVQNHIQLTVLSSTFGRVAGHNQSCYVPVGSFMGNSSYVLEEGLSRHSLNLSESLSLVMQSYLGAPYLWGGKTPFGIDCSGLVQIFARLAGVYLPRDAKDQARCGEDVLLNQFEVGDLIFLDGRFTDQVTHVGIFCGDAQIFHASGTVRIDAFYADGIWSKTTGQKTHKYLFAKRIKSPL